MEQNNKNSSDFLVEALERFNSAEMQQCVKSIDKISGYDLQDEDKQIFLRFHKFVTDPQPHFISHWRADSKQEHWYILLVNGILGNVQGSVACVLYHYQNILKIEQQLIEEIEKSGYRNVMGESVVGLGNTRVLDFEYQAFVLAYRRCLDQFAYAIAAFFKNRYNSFRTLNTFLERRKPQRVAKELIAVHAKYINNFDFVMSEKGVTSVRDRIAHYEYVPALFVNLSAKGLLLVGGGENLNMNGVNGDFLSKVLMTKITHLQRCINEMIDRFIECASVWDVEQESRKLDNSERN